LKRLKKNLRREFYFRQVCFYYIMQYFNSNQRILTIRTMRKMCWLRSLIRENNSHNVIKANLSKIQFCNLIIEWYFVKKKLYKSTELKHSCMPSPLAPDPIRVHSCVWCLFWTNRNGFAVTSIFLSNQSYESFNRRYQ